MTRVSARHVKHRQGSEHEEVSQDRKVNEEEQVGGQDAAESGNNQLDQLTDSCSVVHHQAALLQCAEPHAGLCSAIETNETWLQLQTDLKAAIESVCGL